jgi:hypothetical protein
LGGSYRAIKSVVLYTQARNLGFHPNDEFVGIRSDGRQSHCGVEAFVASREDP